jgi:hypothetical protein
VIVDAILQHHYATAGGHMGARAQEHGIITRLKSRPRTGDPTGLVLGGIAMLDERPCPCRTRDPPKIWFNSGRHLLCLSRAPGRQAALKSSESARVDDPETAMGCGSFAERKTGRGKRLERGSEWWECGRSAKWRAGVASLPVEVPNQRGGDMGIVGRLEVWEWGVHDWLIDGLSS